MSNSTDKKIKVIYCMGSGRSGSTLLSIMLAHHPEMVGPGEINSVFKLDKEKFNCSCESRVKECEYWQKVYATWRAHAGDEGYQCVMQHLKELENLRSPWAWLQAWLNFPGKKSLFSQYNKSTYHFLNSISEHSDRPVIVDISKNPLRAFLMLKNPNIDLRLIHLVRDGRGVAWSLNKFTKASIKQRSVRRTALFWLIVNKQSNFVRKRAVNSCVIRYEDLINEPEKTLRQIGEMAEINPEPVIERLNQDLAPVASHIMAGNKLRRNKSIRLKLNLEWQENLGSKKENQFMRIAGNTMRSFGYKKFY